jgi:hypothetical protein
MGDGVRTHHIAALPFMINASSHCRKTSWCLVELPSPLEGIVERQGWAGPLQNVAALIQALAGITRVSPGGPMPVGRADRRTGSCAFPLACPGPTKPSSSGPPHNGRLVVRQPTDQGAEWNQASLGCMRLLCLPLAAVWCKHPDEEPLAEPRKRRRKLA